MRGQRGEARPPDKRLWKQGSGASLWKSSGAKQHGVIVFGVIALDTGLLHYPPSVCGDSSTIHVSVHFAVLLRVLKIILHGFNSLYDHVLTNFLWLHLI